MEKVSKEEFFAAVGNLNVHPMPVIASLKSRYHISIWELLDNRKVVGKTESDSRAAEPTKYYLSE